MEKGIMMDNIFEFLKISSLNKDSFNEKVEFLIDDFLVKELITLIYADGGTGKSYIAFALTKKLCKIDQKVFFIDYDNPVSVLKQRGIDKLLIEKFNNLSYIQRSQITLNGYELVLKLEESAVGKAYKNCVFVLDSLRDFTDVYNDNKINRLFEALKKFTRSWSYYHYLAPLEQRRQELSRLKPYQKFDRLDVSLDKTPKQGKRAKFSFRGTKRKSRDKRHRI